MTKMITRRGHGVIDYGYAFAAAMLPFIAGFSKEKKAKNTALAISGAVLASSVFTDYELGVVKLIPFKAHLVADVAVGLFAIGAPRLLGFHKNTRAREVFYTAGLAALLVVANTRASARA